MKDYRRDSSESPIRNSYSSTKLIIWFIIFMSLSCVFYTLNLIYSPHAYNQNPITTYQHFISPSASIQPDQQNPKKNQETQLHHIVFGIATSAELWNKRKNYTKLWWRPEEMRGYVWLDKPVKSNTQEEQEEDESKLPHLRISSNTSAFRYTHKNGHRSALRISRIVWDTLRVLKMKVEKGFLDLEGKDEVRWLVMGDDDTLFVPTNLVSVLKKYDHNEFYYIGSSSESHLQNIHFSYNMAYGGGGFAISYPLAKSLVKMQDRCIQRYPDLYGSDDRIQACMAELGVPLTKEVGFHQCDVYGDMFGLLAAHPIAPLVSLHHLDIVEPIFPSVNRFQALQRFKVPMKLDPAGLLQQSICYDKLNKWTISVSWGYVVQIFESIISAREMELPVRTFLDWHRKADDIAFPFNTRPPTTNPCQTPLLYFLSNALYNPTTNWTASEYVQYLDNNKQCKTKKKKKKKKHSPFDIHRVVVYKEPNPYKWEKQAPRRNCCRILPTVKNNTIVIEVGDCLEDEIIEL